MRACAALVLVAACYAPSLPTGASCANGEPCPEGLTCASATKTCESGPGTAADGQPVGGEQPPPDVPPVQPAIALLGIADSAANGTEVKLVVGKAVPVGTLVVAAIAARGETPTSVTDKKNNTWTRDVEIENLSMASVAAVFHTTITNALEDGDEITAKVTTATAQVRKLAVFQLDGATALDQTGSAMTTGTSALVTTAGAVTSPTQLMIGAVATGFNTADSFMPGAGFTEVHEFGTQFSSGSFDTKVMTTASGPQTMSVGTSHDTANYAVVLATFR